MKIVLTMCDPLHTIMDIGTQWNGHDGTVGYTMEHTSDTLTKNTDLFQSEGFFGMVKPKCDCLSQLNKIT